MCRKAPAQRHPLVQISRGRDPEEAVQVRRRGALVRAEQPRREVAARAHVQLLEHGLGLVPRQVAVRAMFRDELLEPRPTMIFLFQHPERREWRENTGTYGLYEWGSSGFAAAYGISLSRQSRDRLYPPLRPIN